MKYTSIKIVLIAFGLMQPPVWAEPADPEVTTQLTEKKAVFARSQMAVTANPHASQAVLDILKEGGSALDAAIAAQMVLTLVEPQSSGIGGGAFLLYYHGKSHRLTSFDGREKAPLSASSDRFLKPDGSPESWKNAWGGGRSVGVPGVVAMLELAHQSYGKLPWARLFKPAIRLSEKGFKVSPRLAGLLAKEYNPWLKKLSPARDYFYPHGKPLRAGQWLANPKLAQSFKAIAKQGSKGFYQGRLARELVAAVQGSPLNPGDLSLNDLLGYRAVERKPICSKYRQYQVCGMAPPSSGGLAVSQILGLLEPFEVSGLAQGELTANHLFTQASRLAFADRNLYVGDSDFVKVPAKAMLSPDYLQQRARLISSSKDLGKASAGTPVALMRQPALSPEFANTSHLSIVDGYGNWLSMTTSIEMAFGSGLMAGGFLLNNQLTDFSFVPVNDGLPVANAVAPGKRPRSSMAPTLVLDAKQQPYLAIGSPGGSRIINYVAQTLVAVLDGQLTVQQAINLPKITNRNDYTALEKGRWSKEQVKGFEAMGHVVKEMDLNSGLHGIQKVPEGYLGGADERREGVVQGD